jgi:hypothetical protein
MAVIFISSTTGKRISGSNSVAMLSLCFGPPKKWTVYKVPIVNLSADYAAIGRKPNSCKLKYFCNSPQHQKREEEEETRGDMVGGSGVLS